MANSLPDRHNPRRARTAPLVLVLIILLAIGDGAVYLMIAGRGSQSTKDANIEGAQIVVSARIVGQIASLAKEERAPVAKDEVLVVFDDRNLRIECGGRSPTRTWRTRTSPSRS